MNKNALEELPFLDGKFLVAMPGMVDPRFAHAVIFMCAHTPEGAMGLMINRAVDDLDFTELMAQLDINGTSADTGPDIYFGGPVEHGRGFVLHSTDYFTNGGTMAISDDFGMTATMDILRDIANGKGPMQRLLCLGYSGWGPGQLEAEIQANGWLICDADPMVVFNKKQDEKWAAAMSSLGFDPAMLSSEGGRA
ncbi:MAG: YqgE/AlgH family protein [Paracoccaceae bacterium]